MKRHQEKLTINNQRNMLRRRVWKYKRGNQNPYIAQ